MIISKKPFYFLLSAVCFSGALFSMDRTELIEKYYYDHNHGEDSRLSSDSDENGSSSSYNPASRTLESMTLESMTQESRTQESRTQESRILEESIIIKELRSLVLFDKSNFRKEAYQKKTGVKRVLCKIGSKLVSVVGDVIAIDFWDYQTKLNGKVECFINWLNKTYLCQEEFESLFDVIDDALWRVRYSETIDLLMEYYLIRIRHVACKKTYRYLSCEAVDIDVQEKKRKKELVDCALRDWGSDISHGTFSLMGDLGGYRGVYPRVQYQQLSREIAKLKYSRHSAESKYLEVRRERRKLAREAVERLSKKKKGYLNSLLGAMDKPFRRHTRIVV